MYQIKIHGSHHRENHVLHQLNSIHVELSVDHEDNSIDRKIQCAF